MNALFNSNLNSLSQVHKGKVRDIYQVYDAHWLIVTTDRLSAFDVVLPDPIPGKGAVLTKTSNFWFAQLSHLIPNHLSTLTLEEAVKDPLERQVIKDQAIVVKKMRPLAIEAIVRGYLVGSGWKDYQKTGTVCGHHLPSGLKLADRLPEALYTPSTKAAAGAHDENVDMDYTVRLLGKELAEQVRTISLRLYNEAAGYALKRGIIIADTKFEFGLDDNNKLTLIDEALTPDSSRFWPADQYQPGISPPSFDKQFVRDYLETLNWNKQAPAPSLPAEIISRTAEKYQEALKRLTTQ